VGASLVLDPTDSVQKNDDVSGRSSLEGTGTASSGFRAAPHLLLVVIVVHAIDAAKPGPMILFGRTVQRRLRVQQPAVRFLKEGGVPPVPGEGWCVGRPHKGSGRPVRGA
jgi:hypothetical protein